VVDLSVWSQELINYLTAHMDSERDVLRSYAELAETAESGHVRYLIELILADEVRHHQLFGEMINALRAEMDQRDISPRLPDFRPGLASPEILDETRRLLKLEKRDTQDLTRLKRELSKVDDTRWWSVLVDVMKLDTKKHVMLLELIEEGG
jgi:rubrerythrin